MAINIEGKILEEILKLPDYERDTISFERNGYQIRIIFYDEHKGISIRFNDILISNIDFIDRNNNNDYKAFARLIENIVDGEGE